MVYTQYSKIMQLQVDGLRATLRCASPAAMTERACSTDTKVSSLIFSTKKPFAGSSRSFKLALAGSRRSFSTYRDALQLTTKKQSIIITNSKSMIVEQAWDFAWKKGPQRLHSTRRQCLFPDSCFTGYPSKSKAPRCKSPSWRSARGSLAQAFVEWP